MAKLTRVAAELRWAADGGITREVRRELAKAARPLVPLARAAILNIPVKGTTPWPPQVPGLRQRIARCVEGWAWANGDTVSVGVAVQARKMPDTQKSLPLYMNGSKAPWRHPVFGDRENWVSQAPKPYWDAATAWYGPASRRALDVAVQKIARRLQA